MCSGGLCKEFVEIAYGSLEEGLRGVWRNDLGCFVVLGDFEKSPLKELRGVWRINLRCFGVLGDYEKSALKDLRGVWRKDLGEYGGMI